MQIGARSKAQPLHDRDVSASSGVFALGHDLMALLSADTQRFRGRDSNVLEIRNCTEYLACELAALSGLRGSAIGDGDHDMWFGAALRQVVFGISEHHRTSSHDTTDAEAGKFADLERQ